MILYHHRTFIAFASQRNRPSMTRMQHITLLFSLPVRQSSMNIEKKGGGGFGVINKEVIILLPSQQTSYTIFGLLEYSENRNVSIISDWSKHFIRRCTDRSCIRVYFTVIILYEADGLRCCTIQCFLKGYVKVLMYTYKEILNMAPSYLKCLINVSNSVITTRSSTKTMLIS